jgi:WD40 repeat protein
MGPDSVILDGFMNPLREHSSSLIDFYSVLGHMSEWTIKLWNLSTAQLLYAFGAYDSRTNELPICALTFSADGCQMVSVSQQDQQTAIKIWKIDGLR